MQNTDEEGTASKPKRVRLGTSANGLNEGQQQQLSNEKLKALPLADENLVDIVTFLSRDDQDPVTITTRQLQRAIKQMKEPTLRRLHAVLIHAGGADIRTASDDEEPNEINSVEEAFRWADCSYVKTLTLGGLTWTETDGRSIDTAFRALTIKTESVEIEGCSFKRAPADVLHYIARLCIPGGSFRMVRCLAENTQFADDLFGAARDARLMHFEERQPYGDDEGTSNAAAGILAFLSSELEGPSTTRYLKVERADVASPQFPAELVQAAEAGSLKSCFLDLRMDMNGAFSQKHAAFITQQDMFETVYDFEELGLTLTFRHVYGYMIASYSRV